MSQNQRHVLTVKQLNQYIKMKLDTENMLQDVWIRGEISNFTHHSSGHMYFTLKDADSRLKCMMFLTNNQKLSFLPREGTLVIARGHISVFERDGIYQLYVNSMQLDGIGSLFLAYEQLKQKLEKEGLFAKTHKKLIPRFPKAIGIITSPTGAAIRDILTTLKRRYPFVPILLCPVQVQGDQAALSIVRAIAWMNMQSDIDVLIVGRGGGSIEELWAFNEEKVARSIFASRIPVISAIGHETDFTIADFVADLRAATPTAAAELAVPHQLELSQQLLSNTNRLQASITRNLVRNQTRIEQLRRSPYFLHPHRWMLIQPAERLDRMKAKLHLEVGRKLSLHIEQFRKLEHRLHAHSPMEQITVLQERTRTVHHQLTTTMLHLLQRKKQSWQASVRHLDALSPLKVMQRGYSLVYDKRQQNLIRSIQQVHIGDEIHIQFNDGHIHTRVSAKEENKGE